MLVRCADAGLVEQYKSFQKRMKAERNAFAGGHLDDAQLQENLRRLRREKAECACRIEASIRQSGSQALERVEQGSLALARKTFAEADDLEKAATRLRQTAARQEELGRIAGSVGRVCLGAAAEDQADQPPRDDEEDMFEPPKASASKPDWEVTWRSEGLPATETPALWAARAAAHRERAKEATAQKQAAEKAAKKEKTDGYRSMTTADLRAKLDAAGLDSSGSKAALVKRLLNAPPAAASGCAAGGPEVAPSPAAPAAPPSEEGASAPPAPAAAAGPPRTLRARVQAALSYAAFGRRPPLLKRKRETPRSSADAGGTVETASDFKPFEGGDAAPVTPPIDDALAEQAGRLASRQERGVAAEKETYTCSVVLGRGSKWAGGLCGHLMPCKRHEKQAATKAAAKPAARPPAAVAPRERQDVEGSHSAVGAGIRPVGTRCAIFSFFSGAGFMDLGFEREQFEVAFTIELSTHFCRAYKYSRERMGMPLPRFGCNKGDVSQIEHVTLRTRVERMRSEGKLVGFIGGPPCQDFSKAGKNLGESGDDGKLTGAYFDLILEMKPDFVVFENVDNLYIEHRAYYESQKQKLEDTHWMTDKVVSCLELGVPQDRRRLILFGVCRDLLHHLHQTDLKSLEDEFWGGVPYPNASEAVDWPRVDEYLPNGERPMPPGIQAYRELTIEECFLRNDVGNHANGEHFLKPKSQRIETVQEGDVSRKSFKRPHRWRYAPTAAYGNNEVPLHPYKSRRMSAAEALAIQSLPKEFELPPDMPLTHMFKTIGNGVPFLAAKHFAGRVHAFLERVSVASSGASSSPPASST